MENLKILRLQFGYSQEYVATKLNVKQNTYSQYETGVREIPISALIILANLYDTSIDYIVGITNEEQSYPKKI